MAIEVLMPALSPTMTEGNLARWLKKEGDMVSPGDVIAEIETDKATMEVECIEEGKLGKIVIPEATPGVKVNQLIAVLIEDGEGEAEIDAIIKSHDDSFVQKKPNTKPTQNATESAKSSLPTDPTPIPVADGNALKDTNYKASPLAKRMAKDKGLQIENITGSGPKGRVIKRDVESFNAMPQLSENLIVSHEDRTIPLTQMRKVIAERLLEAKQTVPHFYLTAECIVDDLIEMRKEMNADLEKSGAKISVNDLIIKACAKALRDVPEANTSWNGDSITQFGNVDISVAVATEDGGLITPIVKAADQLGLVQISTQMKQLVKKANDGALQPHEFQGGSFCISNLGMYNVDEFQAIINPPQASILAVGGAIKKPVVKGDEIKPGHVMKISLSCDHRVIDGKVAALLLNRIKRYIEKPYMLLI